ncbi:MAG TPA: hypothetical protein VK596_07285, partial [Edaphobacter sp.]|nr:hypothetical protein [Edaphobacter sp.]
GVLSSHRNGRPQNDRRKTAVILSRRRRISVVAVALNSCSQIPSIDSKTAPGNFVERNAETALTNAPKKHCQASNPPNQNKPKHIHLPISSLSPAKL